MSRPDRRTRSCLWLAAALVLASPASSTAWQGGFDPDHAAHDHSLNTAIPPDSVLATIEGPPRLGVVFDLVSRDRAIHAPVHQPFDFYVVATGAVGGVNGWEASVVLDPRINVIDRQADGFNVGKDDGWMVGLGETCRLGQLVNLVHYRAVLLEEGAKDLVIGLGPFTKSSFDPASPGYLTCLAVDDLRAFASCDTCAVVNPEKVQLDPDDRREDEGVSPLFEPPRSRH